MFATIRPICRVGSPNMPLESLLQLVETLRERISAHRAALSQSEALTRYTLIDPLLRELGWDTEDPSMVVPEYRVPNNQIADYVLFNDGNPAIVVESKKLDESLRGGRALDQGILYCAHTQASYFLLTDGNRWELFDSGSTIPRTTFSLSDDPPSRSCLRALALWRSSVQSGTVAQGASPILAQAIQADSSPATIPIPVANTTPPVVHSSEVLNQQGWQSLSDVSWGKGHPKPAEIRFPDNSSVAVSTWNSLMIEPVRWLTKVGYLMGSRCPIQRGERYLVSTGSTHSTGTPMKQAKAVNSLYVETNYSARDCLRNANLIIEHVGQDPADFKVRFS